MFCSYFIKYAILGCGFINEAKYIVYTDKKILTNNHIVKLEDEMFIQYKKTHSIGTGIKIEDISFLGTISSEEVQKDEYMVYLPIKL